jgi:Rhodopirellula transposase DDE domain
MQNYPTEVEQKMRGFYRSLSEKDRRRYAAVEALKLGRGGLSYISQLFGCDDEAMQRGKRELNDEESLSRKRQRRAGGGRKSSLATMEGIDEAFLKVIAEHTAGSPMTETIKWTNLTRAEIANLLKAEGINISVTVVDQLLEKYYYRKRKAQKSRATGTNPQRNEQFENIAVIRTNYQAVSNPILSMDTKKKS